MNDVDVVAIVRGVKKFEPGKIPRKEWVRYLSVRDYLRKEIEEDIVKGDPGEAFGKTVAAIVNAYMFKDKTPPAEIAPAIYNIADDCLSGREPILRAGDYISLQNYVRKQVSK